MSHISLLKMNLLTRFFHHKDNTVIFMAFNKHVNCESDNYDCQSNVIIKSFPFVFKEAIVVQIYKKAKGNLVTNYRTITILHNLSKVFEQIIFNRIISFTNHNKILPENQFLDLSKVFDMVNRYV